VNGVSGSGGSQAPAAPVEPRSRAPRVAAVVLAAGASTRMGAETNKLVEIVHGRPVVAAPVDALLSAGCAPVVVVTGFEAERVRAALAGRACRFVHHPGWREGMGRSLACGIAALGAEAPSRDAEAPEAVLVCVGDVPALRRAHVEAVVAAACGGDGEIDPRRIAAPVHAGRRGHPVLFGAAYLEALGRLAGDEGARAVVAANQPALRLVEVADDGVLVDVDTPEALAGARARPPSDGEERS